MAPRGAVLRLWVLHLLCFVMPLTTTLFALTGPHSPWTAAATLGVVAASVVIDRRASADRRQPAQSLPRWPFDAVLYALAALQLLNVALIARLASIAGLWSVDAGASVVLMGVTSGYSGIVVAHELIHRREAHRRWLGRLLLASVLYEHFSTEHVRGHHPRVGTLDDPATARHGERYLAFLRRTVPAQFRSAWNLEKKRLGDVSMRWHDRRMLESRVVHGLALEAVLLLAITGIFGIAGLVVFLLQATLAVVLLEAVNYFEHYGILRESKRVQPVHSWDTDSWFTLYTLVGLSRHADHHAFACRPYQQLRHWCESPKLPYGYFGMVWLVLTNNDRFFELMHPRLDAHRQRCHSAQAAQIAA